MNINVIVVVVIFLQCPGCQLEEVLVAVGSRMLTAWIYVNSIKISFKKCSTVVI